MLDRNSLYSAYFTRDKLVHHHINSFNDFIDKGLQKVIDEVNIIETNIENTYVKLGNIRVEKPMVREADGSVTQWRYVGVSLSYDDAGEFAGDKKVDQTVSFMAERRLRVA